MFVDNFLFMAEQLRNVSTMDAVCALHHISTSGLLALGYIGMYIHIYIYVCIYCKNNVAVGKHQHSVLITCFSIGLEVVQSVSTMKLKGATAYIHVHAIAMNRHDCTRRYISTCLPKECL